MSCPHTPPAEPVVALDIAPFPARTASTTSLATPPCSEIITHAQIQNAMDRTVRSSVGGNWVPQYQYQQLLDDEFHILVNMKPNTVDDLRKGKWHDSREKAISINMAPALARPQPKLIRRTTNMVSPKKPSYTTGEPRVVNEEDATETSLPWPIVRQDDDGEFRRELERRQLANAGPVDPAMQPKMTRLELSFIALTGARACGRVNIPHSPFCRVHSCRAQQADGTQCPNPVPNPLESHMICSQGWHSESRRDAFLYQHIEIAEEIKAAQEALDEEERQSAMDHYNALMGDVDGTEDGYVIYKHLNKDLAPSRRSSIDMSASRTASSIYPIGERRGSMSRLSTPGSSRSSSTASTAIRTPITPERSTIWPQYTVSVDPSVIRPYGSIRQSSSPLQSQMHAPQPRVVSAGSNISTAPHSVRIQAHNDTADTIASLVPSAIYTITEKHPFPATIETPAKLLVPATTTRVNPNIHNLRIEIPPVQSNTLVVEESPLSPSSVGPSIRRASISPYSAKAPLPTVQEEEEVGSPGSRSITSTKIGISPKAIAASHVITVDSNDSMESRSAELSSSPCSTASQLRVVLGSARRTPATTWSLTSAKCLSKPQPALVDVRPTPSPSTPHSSSCSKPLAQPVKMSVKQRIAAKHHEPVISIPAPAVMAAKPDPVCKPDAIPVTSTMIKTEGFKGEKNNKMARIMRKRFDGVVQRRAWGREHEMDRILALTSF